MSAFAVFATVLTIGYIIYYGFTISRDIIANKKAEKSEVETFEVEPVQEPQPTTVSESGEGFTIATKVIEESTEELPALPVFEDTIPATPVENQEGASAADLAVEKAKEEMEPMTETSQPGFNPDEMDSLINDSIAFAMGNNVDPSKPRIACEVLDESHGKPVPDNPDDNVEDKDTESEIRL